MLDEAKKKEWQAVIVYKLDRFARNKYDSVIHKHNLKKLGVKVLSATEALSDTPEGRLMESLLESFAEMFSENLSQRVKNGILESLMKGNFIGGTILYGYKVVDKKILIDEKKAEIVRYVFKEYAKGKSKKQIMQEMNNKGWRLDSGKQFDQYSFQNALSNRKYMGEYNKHDIQTNSYPAIIDKETFDKVQGLLKLHKHAPATQKAKVEYLLTGTAICVHCGSDMIGISGTSKTGKSHCYYVCSNRRTKKQCDKSHEPKEIAEDTVFNECLVHVEKNLPTFASGIHAEYERSCTTTAVKDFEKRIAQVDKELDKCFDMILNADTDEIKSRANAKAKDLEIQKKDLQAELLKINKAQGLKNKTFADILSGLQVAFAINDYGIERRKRLINDLVSIVLMSNDETIVIIDENGLDKLDVDWQEWYNDIDWEIVHGSNDDDDKNGGDNNGGTCGGCSGGEILDNNSGNNDNIAGCGVRISSATLCQKR